MLTIIKKLLFLLSKEERRSSFFLSIFIFAMSILDMMGVASILPFVTVLSSPESIPECIEVDMEEIKTKENVRLSSLSLNEGYDFPTNLKEQDPVLVSVLTARGGTLDFEDEIAEDEEEGTEEGTEETTEGADEKPAEDNSSENSGEKSE